MIKKRGNETEIEEVVLRNTGYENINDFLYGKEEYKIDGLEEAAYRIKNAIAEGKKITIVGDYDVDGVDATAILYMTLKKLNANVTYRLPKRFSEGFGLSEKIVDEIDSGLLITVDNGVAALDAIKKAKDKGLEVIVTDHHMPVIENGIKKLPEADMIIDPNAIDGQADFNGYCGAGIAYKLSSYLVDDPVFNDKMLCFAALGTVSDVMELKEENRFIVQEGLKNMVTEGKRTNGLKAILSKQYCDKHICAKDIGFKIGPMINAGGRLIDDGANKPLAIMTQDGGRYDWTVADEIFRLNNLRKQYVEDNLPKYIAEIENNNMRYDLPIVVYVPGVPEGIVGIIAGKLVEKYNTPIIALSDSENEEVAKGSARSAKEINLKELLDKSPEEFVKYGGHAEAAGVSIRKDNIEHARKTLNDNCFLPLGYVEDDNLYYDLEIKSEDTKNIYEKIEKFAPFGQGNPDIVFKITGFEVEKDANSGLKYELKGADKYIKISGRVFEDEDKTKKGTSFIGFGDSQILVECVTSDLMYDLSLIAKKNYFTFEDLEQIRFGLYYYTRFKENYRNNIEGIFEKFKCTEEFKNICYKEFDKMIVAEDKEKKKYMLKKLLALYEEKGPEKLDFIGTLSKSYFKDEQTIQVDLIKVINPEKILEKDCMEEVAER